MNKAEEFKALKQIRDAIFKIKNKENDKLIGIADKLENHKPYVTYKGDCFYSIQDIMDCYEADCFTVEVADALIAKLEAKQNEGFYAKHLNQEEIINYKRKVLSNILEGMDLELEELRNEE